MIRNYLKIAFRNLKRNKGFSFINILGLSIGMAGAILIMLWIQHEVSYDQFHEKKDRIYQAYNRATHDGKTEAWSATPKIMASAIQRDNPEVEHVTRITREMRYLFTIGEKKLTVSGNIVDSSFLQVFSFPIIKGNPKTALLPPNSILLTEKLAQKLFPGENAMGKIILIGNITTLLSKDFLKLVIISFAIAAPVAYWAMFTWLKDYPYRTDIPVWAFAAAGIVSVLISLLTVSSQAIKAAIQNPVTSLRSE
jgi:hypothetical protein